MQLFLFFKLIGFIILFVKQHTEFVKCSGYQLSSCLFNQIPPLDSTHQSSFHSLIPLSSTMIFSALVTAVTVAVSNAQGDVFHNGANTNQVISRSDFIGAVAAEVGEDQVIRGDITNGNAPKMPAKVSEGSGNDILLKTFVTNSKKLQYPFPDVTYYYDCDFELTKGQFSFKAYTPTDNDVCNDPAHGNANNGPLTYCQMWLTLNHDDEGVFNYAKLKFINCFDDALIDHAYLRQRRWVKCGFWDGCGFDGGYWKSGPRIAWGVNNNGYSWCLGDDPDAWKQYSKCGFQCLQDCGEGHWVPSKECMKEYVFRKDGNVYSGSP